MSVQGFINELYNSDFDLSNQNIDEFIRCIKSLYKIISNSKIITKTQKRDKVFNSQLAKRAFLMDRFKPDKVSNFYTFSCDEIQIDVVIRNNAFGLCCSGWFPSVKSLVLLFNQKNFNFDTEFDFIDSDNINQFISHDSTCQYFLGDVEHFGLNTEGLHRILIIWSYAISSFLSHRYNSDVY